MRGSVLYLFLLKLRVMFNSTLSRVDKNSGVTKILSKKSLKIGSKQRSYLSSMFVLLLVEIDLLIKKRNSKPDMV